jgi:hypothetical protein
MRAPGRSSLRPAVRVPRSSRSPSPVSPCPLVRGAAASAVLLALGGLDAAEAPPPLVVPPAAAARGTAGMAALCGPRTVPEGAACVPLPAADAPLPEAGALAAVGLPGARRAADGTRSGADEHIPRRPERPANAAAYGYPVGAPDQAPAFLASPDDAPNGTQPRQAAGAGASAAAPEPPSWADGVEIAAVRGERVAPLQLERQEGHAEVVFVGELFGITVATAHTVQEGGLARRYLVLYGHLDRPGPGVVLGARLAPSDAVGFAGDSGSGGPARLHLEARQVREGVGLSDLGPKRITDGAVTVPCDLRNVLPLR